MEIISEKTTMSPTTPTIRPCSTPKSPNSPPVSVATPPVVMSPCAACKILRRRCADKCVLAPYFPPTEPLKFSIAHKVFGASNIIKLLQDLPESQRADAVSSMVYEANARLRDPIYGSAGAICQLQKQISDLQAELAKSKAEIVTLKSQHANLLTLICMEVSSNNNIIPSNQDHLIHQVDDHYSFDTNSSFLNFYDDNINFNSIWDPLWT
ncbi:hypothetical protein RND81_08G179000 [Saponaria officinalis]|uniref:LOB domain-containing protein n=1 Tax=Saponaria officinalis TaxID=3572 RepID=A0AAW1J8P9_SAPOF